MKERMLKLLFRHFQFPESCWQTQAYIPHGLVDKRPLIFPHTESGEYSIYSLTAPFQLFLRDYDTRFSTHTFLDMHNQIFAYTENQPESISGLHKHNYFEFVYLLDGQLDFLIEGKHRRYHPGEACIINQNVRHVEGHQSSFTVLYLSFTTEYLDELQLESIPDMKHELFDFFARNQKESEQIDYIDFAPIRTGLEKHAVNIEEAFYVITEELLHQTPGYQDIVNGCIKRLFYYLQSPALYTSSNTRFQNLSGQNLFERTLNYVNANKRKISLAEVSEALNYNANYINRVFLEHTGQTLPVYIRDICLSEAANMLLNTQMSTADIIHRLGFENRTAFYNQFKKKYKVTPQQYRYSASKGVRPF